MFSQNIVFNGLGTFSLNLPSAGDYEISGKITLPTITQGNGPSSLLVTINQNGGPIYVGQVGAEGFRVVLKAAANDLIAIVFTSGAAIDAQLNVIKSNISISQSV